MSIVFTNLAWAGLLALVAIPILVHLFARSKPPSYRFSDNRFLRRILKKTARFQKPQDFLILVLRCLAALALLAAFLQPLLVSDPDEEGITSKKAVVFVIDKSSSMSAMDGATTRFDQAIQVASTILKESQPDLANVVWIDSEPHAIFSELGQNKDYINKSLSEARASHENAAVKRAIELAVNQVEAVTGSKKIIIISDFQKENWSNLNLNVPKGVSLETLSVSETPVSNMALSDLFTVPSQPILGEPVELVATVSNFSEEDRRVRVFIDSGGGRSAKEVDVPAWSKAQVIHSIRLSKPGEVVVSARLEEDGYPVDDVFYNKLMVRERLRIAVIGDSIPAPLLRLAYALPWLEVMKVPNLEQARVYDFVFWDQWQGLEAEAIQELIDFGVSVFITIGRETNREDLAKLLDVSEVGSLALQEKEDGWSVIVKDLTYAAVKLFQSGEYGVPGEGIHRKRFALAKSLPQDSILLSYADGTPAWLRLKNPNKGSLHVMNMSLDPDYSDWAERSAFVSFLAETLLAERKQADVDSYTYPGIPIGLFPGTRLDKQSISLVRNEQKLELSEAQTANGLQLVSPPIEAPGVYQWKVGPDLLRSSTVNMVSSESDLRFLSPEEITFGDQVTKSQLLRRASMGDGLNLWGICIALTAFLLVIEMIVAALKPKAKEAKV